MAYVGFKLGTQADLDTMYTNKTAAEGTFYLTNDTNRLYIGKTGGVVAAVNEGVITVDAVANLPKGASRITGSFYYAIAENVLCVFNGSSWVQINAVVTNNSMGTALTSSNGTVTVETNITDSLSETKRTSYTVTGANGITVSSTGTAMTITGDPISVAAEAGSSNDATVSIKSNSSTTNGSFGIKGGSNVTVTADDDNIIIVAAKDTTINSVSTTANDTNSGDNTSGFNIIVTDSENAEKKGLLDPIIKIGNNESQVKFIGGVADLDVYTISEVDGLISDVNKDFQTALRGFNAMEYKGTVGTTTADHGATLPTTNVKSGYSYLVTGDSFTGADGKKYPAGTLVVAYGTEDEAGYLNPIYWSYVTGSVTDTQYTGAAISGGITLTQKNNNEVVMKLTAKSADNNTDGFGEDIVITSSNNSGTSQELSFAHKRYKDSVTGTKDDDQPAAMTAVSTYDIPVISDITIKNGHVTGYKTKTYKVIDTNSSLSINTTFSADSLNTTGTVTQQFILSNALNEGVPSYSNFTINSSSLEVKANTNADNGGLVMNLVWGSF